MLRIRLRRIGRKHDPSYRVIVTEKGRSPQTGAYVEALGTYDPSAEEYELKDGRIEHWLSEGAQPSDTVHNLLVTAGVVDGDAVNPLPNKTPVEEQPADGSETDDKTGEPEAETSDDEGEASSDEDTTVEAGDDGSDETEGGDTDQVKTDNADDSETTSANDDGDNTENKKQNDNEGNDDEEGSGKETEADDDAEEEGEESDKDES